MHPLSHFLHAGVLGAITMCIRASCLPEMMARVIAACSASIDDDDVRTREVLVRCCIGLCAQMAAMPPVLGKAASVCHVYAEFPYILLVLWHLSNLLPWWSLGFMFLGTGATFRALDMPSGISWVVVRMVSFIW